VLEEIRLVFVVSDPEDLVTDCLDNIYGIRGINKALNYFLNLSFWVCEHVVERFYVLPKHK